MRSDSVLTSQRGRSTFCVRLASLSISRAGAMKALAHFVVVLWARAGAAVEIVESATRGTIARTGRLRVFFLTPPSPHNSGPRSFFPTRRRRHRIKLWNRYIVEVDGSLLGMFSKHRNEVDVCVRQACEMSRLVTNRCRDFAGSCSLVCRSSMGLFFV